MMKKSKFLLSLLAGASTFCGSANAAEIETNSAVMQAMDKVTGRVSKIIVPVNSEVTFGDFSLVIRSCKKRPAEEAPENFAFVDVTDKSFGDQEYNIFRGWMLSSTPGINAIEHPIYDVWLLECTNDEVKNTKFLTKEELDKRDNLPTKEFLQQQNKSEKQESVKAAKQTEEQPQEIRINNFINEDRDIEKDIKTDRPAYISETSAAYVSDIAEGEEPENLLQFTSMQEIKTDTKNSKTDDNADAQGQEADDDLSAAIDAEMKELKH